MATVRFAAYPVVPADMALRVINPAGDLPAERQASVWITSLEQAEEHLQILAQRLVSAGRQRVDGEATGLCVVAVWPENKRRPAGWDDAQASGRLRCYVEFPAPVLH